MNQDTIDRYQPGGDIYQTLCGTLGVAAANDIADAAATGDQVLVTTTYSKWKFGSPLNTSTTDILIGQLANDPLGAPLASLDGQLSKVLGDLFKNPLVLIALAAGLFFYFGGANLIRGKMK